MIDGEDYIKAAKIYFSFLEKEFAFSILNKKINGNYFYDLEYKDKTRIISISYENIPNCFQVSIFILENGKRPNYDDKAKTLHINTLNRILFPLIEKNEIISNEKHFIEFTTKNNAEKMLLKSAKELRLCLLHFDKAIAS
jgi:hypothetical protein